MVRRSKKEQEINHKSSRREALRKFSQNLSHFKYQKASTSHLQSQLRDVGKMKEVIEVFFPKKNPQSRHYIRGTFATAIC